MKFHPDPSPRRGFLRASCQWLAVLAAVLLAFLPSTASAMGVASSKSLLDLYRDGGPIMHLIALCSVLDSRDFLILAMGSKTFHSCLTP
ncbi:MAG: hypothetical protein WCG76_02670 [Verrucomicrobiota bacterium]